VVKLHKLTVSYRQCPALLQVSGHFLPGSMTAVIGPNGSGKSTLLKSIMGLLPVEDERTASSLTVSTPRQRVAYLPQLNEIERNFPIDVRDCVLLGCWASTGAWGRVNASLLSRVETALQAVGLQGFERRNLGSLSGGQLQRVMFARLMVQDAELILLDEPFTGIDTRTTASLLQLVQHWHAQQRTVIAVLHNDTLVQQYFPDTLLLARKVVAWGPTGQVLTPPHIAQARTLAESWSETCELSGAAA
jgi:zinc/manganese transport system ATP-binding protein